MPKIRSTRYKVIETFDEIKQLCDYCEATGYASFDFETKARGPHGSATGEQGESKLPTGPQYKEDDCTTVSISFQPHSSYVIPLFHFEGKLFIKHGRKGILKVIKYLNFRLFENRKIIKVGFNLKFELKWLLRYGCNLKGICLDMMLGKYLLNEERPNDLKSLVASLIEDYAGYDHEIDIAVRKYKGWGNVPLKILAPYNAMDSDVTLRLVSIIEPKLIKTGFYKLFRNMCSMQTKVLAESETMGLGVDREYLNKITDDTRKEIELKLKRVHKHPTIRKYQRWRIKTKLKKLIRECKKEIADIRSGKLEYKFPDRAVNGRVNKISRYIAGQLTTKKERVEDFNPNSVPQMVELLYTSPRGFNFKIPKYTKDKRTKQDTDNPSTDEEALLTLKKKDKTGFIDELLGWRETVKLYGTYMVGMQYRLTDEDRIHSSFLIHGTVTGRLSSKNPNFQNIPRDTTSGLIKKMFIPPPGHLLLEVDYGQAELRVAAEVANDEAMIDIFRRNYNIHVATACKMNKCYDKYDMVKGILSDPKHPDNVKWEKEKKKGKTLNFSILYLQSDEETANQMSFEFGRKVTTEEAHEWKQEWFDEFPNIKKWMKKQEAFVREHGYVMNLFGRKRRLPDIWEAQRGKQNKAIRDSINAPIQGASSDFTQFASIVIRERINNGDLILTDDPRYLPQAYTVHDSLGFFVMPKYIQKAVPIISDICSNPETLKYFDFEMKKVKMKVSPEIGVNWGSLKEYNPWENYAKLLTN
jgi:DNA polymerase I-like protein with 3'-5' exonuclease and polymerase domains